MGTIASWVKGRFKIQVWLDFDCGTFNLKKCESDSASPICWKKNIYIYIIYICKYIYIQVIYNIEMVSSGSDLQCFRTNLLLKPCLFTFTSRKKTKNLRKTHTKTSNKSHPLPSLGKWWLTVGKFSPFLKRKRPIFVCLLKKKNTTCSQNNYLDVLLEVRINGERISGLFHPKEYLHL